MNCEHGNHGEEKHDGQWVKHQKDYHPPVQNLKVVPMQELDEWFGEKVLNVLSRDLHMTPSMEV